MEKVRDYLKNASWQEPLILSIEVYNIIDTYLVNTMQGLLGTGIYHGDTM